MCRGPRPFSPPPPLPAHPGFFLPLSPPDGHACPLSPGHRDTWPGSSRASWRWAHTGLSVPRLTGSEPLTVLPLTLEPEAAAQAHYKACDRLKLERKQRRMCRRDPGVAETLVEAVSMSALECQFQFRFERWNCTLEGRYRASLLKRGECGRPGPQEGPRQRQQPRPGPCPKRPLSGYTPGDTGPSLPRAPGPRPWKGQPLDLPECCLPCPAFGTGTVVAGGQGVLTPPLTGP